MLDAVSHRLDRRVLLWLFLNTGEFQPWLYRGGFLVVALVTAVLARDRRAPRVARSRRSCSASGCSGGSASGRTGSTCGTGRCTWCTRPHIDVPITGLPLLVIRLTITLVLADLSFRYVEEPIRHGAIGRRFTAFRTSWGEPRRRIATGLVLSGAAVTLSVVIIAAGLLSAEPSAPPSELSEAAVLITPSTTVAPSTATTVAPVAPVAQPGVSQQGPPLVAGRVTMIGDSVMLGAANALQARLGDGLWFDAKQNRQFRDGVDTLRALRDSGQLGTTVVVQLGTNGTVDPGDFDAMMQVLSGARRVVIVTAKVPRSWEEQVNSTLVDGAKRYKNAVVLDWHNIGGVYPEYFYDDAIHLRPEGAAVYTELVATRDRMTALDELIGATRSACSRLDTRAAVDSRDLDALVALFVDDVQVGRQTFGRAALRAGVRSLVARDRHLDPQRRDARDRPGRRRPRHRFGLLQR